MIEMRLMELQADEDRKQIRNYLSGLVHLKSQYRVEQERKWYKVKLAVCLVIGVLMVVWGISEMTSDEYLSEVTYGSSFDQEFFGFISMIVGFMVFVFGGIIFGSHLEDLSEPSEPDMRKLDMAVAASDTVKRLMLHIQWYDSGVRTKALINELFLMAKNESAGAYTKLWTDMEDRSESDTGEPKSEDSQ